MKRGSVMLEFILMMPVLLLLFGGTVLTFEIFIGKLRLQESNRNIAWLANDRYGVSNGELGKMAKSYFQDRNKREKSIDGAGGDLWSSFGGGAYNVVRKQVEDGYYNGHTPWSSLMAGNMVVKMEKISAAYMGAIALSSVLQSNDEEDSKAFYRDSYDISYTHDPGEDGDLTGYDFSPESLVLCRGSNDDGRDESSYRAQRYVEDVWRISLEPWPKKESQSLSAPPAGTAEATEYKRLLYDYTQ